MSVKESILTLTQENPKLNQAEIARELGISREYVGQVVGRVRKEKHCKTCGKIIHGKPYNYAWAQGFCVEHWAIEKERRHKESWVEFTCEYCGKPFFRQRSYVKYNTRLKRFGFRFCNKSCHAKVVFGKRAIYLTFTCERCGGEFRRSKAVVEYRLKTENSRPRWCSDKCRRGLKD